VVSICIIGDSHLSALKGGWDRLIEEYPGTTFTFFSAPNNQINGLRLANDRLVPGTDKLREHLMRTGGAPEIAPTYDVYIVYGLQLQIRHALRMFRRVRTAALKKPRKRKRAIRRSAKVARKTCAIKTLAKLRQCTRAPILLIATPYKPDDPAKPDRLFRKGKGEILKEIFDEMCNELSAKAKAIFVPQPEETIAPSRATTLAHLRSAREGDSTHMNADYGFIVVRHILEIAEAVSPAAS
jgi:hypothetical protein